MVFEPFGATTRVVESVAGLESLDFMTSDFTCGVDDVFNDDGDEEEDGVMTFVVSEDVGKDDDEEDGVAFWSLAGSNGVPLHRTRRKGKKMAKRFK